MSYLLRGASENLSNSWFAAWLESHLEETGTDKHYSALGKQVGIYNVLAKICHI